MGVSRCSSGLGSGGKAGVNLVKVGVSAFLDRKLPGIEGSERDITNDWVIPRGTVPTLNQLEARIDEAVVLARASEDGVREVGEMALDAARQARRAAEAAERSAEAAVEAAARAPVVQSAAQAPAAQDQGLGPAGPVPDLVPPPPATGGGRSPKSAPPTGRDVDEGTSAEQEAQAVPTPQPRFEVRVRSFNERADRVAARLRALQEQRSHPAGPSAVAVRRRGDG